MVRSRGSVGLDESLSLVLQLELPAKWLGRARPQQNGVVVEVPVYGTFSQPRPDKRALPNVLKQLGIQALDQYLGDEIGGALDKLFGGDR